MPKRKGWGAEHHQRLRSARMYYHDAARGMAGAEGRPMGKRVRKARKTHIDRLSTGDIGVMRSWYGRRGAGGRNLTHRMPRMPRF